MGNRNSACKNHCNKCDSDITEKSEDHQDESNATTLSENLDLVLFPEVIHSNSNGSVFRGHLDSRLVAVKKVEELKWWEVQREIQVLSVLNHENIIRFHMKYRKAGILYIVSEYHENSLADFMSVGLLSDYKCFIVQLISAVSYLQSLRIVHLNLAPENIFVVNGLRKRILKLTNFACAVKIPMLSSSVTLSEYQLEGNLFTAPEIHAGNAFMASDIFSMGGIFFYLFSQGMNIRDLRIRNPINILATRRSVVTSSDIFCADLIYKTTSYNPHERISIEEVVEHPLTWDNIKARGFIVEIWKMIETPERKFRELLYANSASVIGENEDWTKRIEDDILSDMDQSFVDYISRINPAGKKKTVAQVKGLGQKNIITLVRAMRSIIVHAPSALIAQTMGTPDTYVNYWSAKFPGLWMHLYNAECRYHIFKLQNYILDL